MCLYPSPALPPNLPLPYPSPYPLPPPSGCTHLTHPPNLSLPCSALTLPYPPLPCPTPWPLQVVLTSALEGVKVEAATARAYVTHRSHTLRAGESIKSPNQTTQPPTSHSLTHIRLSILSFAFAHSSTHHLLPFINPPTFLPSRQLPQP